MELQDSGIRGTPRFGRIRNSDQPSLKDQRKKGICLNLAGVKRLFEHVKRGKWTGGKLLREGLKPGGTGGNAVLNTRSSTSSAPLLIRGTCEGVVKKEQGVEEVVGMQSVGR